MSMIMMNILIVKRSITTAKITKLIMMNMNTAKMNIARNMTSIFGLHLFRQLCLFRRFLMKYAS